MADAGFLLDVNILVALADQDHQHHAQATAWFSAHGHREWALCALTEAGFIRVMTNPNLGALTVQDSIGMLAQMARLPGFRFWPITERWSTLIAPFQQRLFGHRQVTDAYLLGLAIHHNSILVTLDKGLRYMAGEQYAHHLLVLA